MCVRSAFYRHRKTKINAGLSPADLILLVYPPGSVYNLLIKNLNTYNRLLSFQLALMRKLKLRR